MLIQIYNSKQKYTEIHDTNVKQLANNVIIQIYNKLKDTEYIDKK